MGGIRTGKPRGRPYKEESLDGGLIRISNDLKEIIEVEHKEGERFSDTLLRLVRERNFAMQELQINKVIIPDHL